jgi:amidase
MTDPLDLDAVGQAEAVSRGDVTPLELVEGTIARIERLQPVVNALTSTNFDQAVEIARHPDSIPDGPFKGVPTLLKDIGTQQAGLPYWCGNKSLRDHGWRSPRDTHFGRRLRDAGLITLGKTSTPEFGAQPTTQPLAFGPTRNPWDTARSTSGSSGGAAAAVASGMLPMAHANDGYGSIRDPASWCGLVGLKPSRGRITSENATGRVGTSLVVSRTLRDTAAALDALAGAEVGEVFTISDPTGPYVDELGKAPGRLRVGVLTTMDAEGLSVDLECANAATSVASLLDQLGHHVDPDASPRNLIDDESVRDMTRLRAAKLAAITLELNPATNKPYLEDEVEPYAWAVAELGRSVSMTEFVRGTERQQVWVSRIDQWFHDGFDLLVTPTTGTPPLLIEDMTPPAGDPLAVMDLFQTVRGYAAPFNITGHPAISLPLHWTPSGLPVGVQLIAGMGREDLLFRVSAQLDQARPWADRRPSTEVSTVR